VTLASVSLFTQLVFQFDDKTHMADADPDLMHKCDRDIKRLKCMEESNFEDVVECLRVDFDTLGRSGDWLGCCDSCSNGILPL